MDNGYMLRYLKHNPFQKNDLFLLLWVIFGVLIFLEDYRFIYYSPANLTVFRQPFFLIVIYFILMLSSLVFYLFFEYKEKRFKPNIVVLLILFIIIFSQIENIFLAKNSISLFIKTLDGDSYLVNALFNLEVKCIHFFTMFFIIITIFIGVFIFPKRINNYKAVRVAFCLAYILALVSLVYSLFKDDYITLFEVLTFKKTEDYLKLACPRGIFGNSNVYGMFLEALFFVSICHYHLTKKRYLLFITVYSYLHLILTFCKIGIFSTTVAFVIYELINIFKTIRTNNRKPIITYSLLAIAPILVGVSTFLVIINLKGNSSFVQSLFSLTGRVDIWSSCIQIIETNSFIYGYGYGIYNVLVANSNSYYLLIDSPITHNSFIAMIGEGGLLYLLPFITLLSYAFIIVFKNIKNNEIIVPIGCALVSFLIHMCFEDNYYSLIALSVLILVLDNVNKYGNKFIKQTTI